MVNWTKLRETLIGFVIGMVFAQLIIHWDLVSFLLSIAVTLVAISQLYNSSHIRRIVTADEQAFNRFMEAINKIEGMRDRLGLDTEEFT